MRKQLGIFLLLATSMLFAGHASADGHGDKWKLGGQLWVENMQGMGGALEGRHGTNVTRMRLKFQYQFDENWFFRAWITSKAFGPKTSDTDDGDAGGSFSEFDQAVFIGKNQLMPGDQLRIGAQGHPLFHILYPKVKTRWLSKLAWHEENYVRPFQTGVSYGVKFGKLNVNAYALSNEWARQSDYQTFDANGTYNDGGKLYALAIDYEVIKGLTIFGQFGKSTANVTLSKDVDDTTNKTGYDTSSLVVTYANGPLTAALESHMKDDMPTDKAVKTVAEGGAGLTNGKPQTVMGLSGHYGFTKKYGLFLAYYTGYEDDENATKKESILKIGPTMKFAKKIKLGLLHEGITYDKDGVDDDTKIRIILAANF